MNVDVLRGKSIAHHVERRLLGQMRMLIIIVRIEERAEIIDLIKDISYILVCVRQGHGQTAHGIDVALLVFPYIEQSIAVFVLNRGTEDDGAPVHTPAPGTALQNGSRLCGAPRH